MSALPTFAILAAVFLWSSAAPATKFALREMAVPEFVLFRLSLGAVALWLIVLATRTNARPQTAGWRPFVMGLLEPGLVTFLVALGLTMTSPVNGAAFWSLTPLITPILGRVVLGETIEIVVMVAALVACGGTILLAWGQGSHGGGSLLGDLLVASGVLTSAVNALIARRTAQAGANPLVTSSWQLTSACGVAALLLLIMPASGGHAFDASIRSIGALLYLGLVVSAGVFILSNYALRQLPVGRISLFGSLVAPIGTTMSALLLNVQISTLDIAATGLVMLAVALPSLVDRRSRAWRPS
jgi:drug/metabolite transporter (DMT)-like permease